MVTSADTSDQPEKKKPESDPMDFFSQMLGIDPTVADKARLAQQVDGTLDQTLKLLQIMYYTKELGQEKMLEKLMRHYKPAIEMMAENADKMVSEYQKKHGEI
jgi:hypothetical protein